LIATPGYEASLTDLADLLAGHVDLTRVSEMARAFMAVDWSQLQRGQLPRPPENQTWPDETWLAVRLAALPWPLDDNHDIRAESAMIRRLNVGDGQGAVQIALRRLRAVGLRPPMQSAFADAQTARLWAAALAFPISKRTARRAACILDPNYRSY
jgi:CRISPR-associated protein Csx17